MGSSGGRIDGKGPKPGRTDGRSAREVFQKRPACLLTPPSRPPPSIRLSLEVHPLCPGATLKPNSGRLHQKCVATPSRRAKPAALLWATTSREGSNKAGGARHIRCALILPAQSWSNMSNIWSLLGVVVRDRPQIGRSRPKCGRCRTKLGRRQAKFVRRQPKLGRRSPYIWSEAANFSGFRRKLGRTRSNAGLRVGPNLAELGPS